MGNKVSVYKNRVAVYSEVAENFKSNHDIQKNSATVR
jgi:hypothetical protein